MNINGNGNIVGDGNHVSIQSDFADQQNQARARVSRLKKRENELMTWAWVLMAIAIFGLGFVHNHLSNGVFLTLALGTIGSSILCYKRADLYSKEARRLWDYYGLY